MRDFSSERMAVNRLAMITSAYGWCLSRINRDNVGILSLNVRRACGAVASTTTGLRVGATKVGQS